MFKGLFSSAVMAFALLVSGTALAQSYPSGKEFYPAVYGAISELYPDAKYLNIDFYGNTYTLTGITSGSFLSNYSYDLKLRLQDGGEIDAEYSNIYERTTNKGKTTWERKTSFLLYNYKNAIAALKSKIVSIASDEANYSRYLKEALSDIEFVYPIVQNFTELAFKDFAKNYLAESPLIVKAKVFDVKEHGKEVDGVSYKYLLTLNQALFDKKSDATKNPKVYLAAMPDRNLVYMIYTNQDNVVRMSKTSTVTVKGKVIRSERATSNKVSGHIFYLVDE